MNQQHKTAYAHFLRFVAANREMPCPRIELQDNKGVGGVLVVGYHMLDCDCHGTGRIPRQEAVELYAALTEVTHYTQLYCPYCGQNHVDTGDLASDPHKTHLCHSCERLFKPEGLARSVGIREGDRGHTSIQPLRYPEAHLALEEWLLLRGYSIDMDSERWLVEKGEYGVDEVHGRGDLLEQAAEVALVASEGWIALLEEAKS